MLVLGQTVVFLLLWWVQLGPPPSSLQAEGRSRVETMGPLSVTEDTALQGLGWGVSVTTHGTHDLLSHKGGSS